MRNNSIAVALLAAAAVACSGPKGWEIKGTVEGLEGGTSLAIEANNAGRWYTLDSVKVDKAGKFDYRSGEPAPSADILRVTLPGKGSVYFPVEGTDAVTLEATAATFGTGHRLSGTDLAATIGAVDSIVAATPSIQDLQRKLTGFILSDTTGIVAFYTVGKSVDGRPVFDPAENFGNRIYGAAAQVYAHYNPLDPHGDALKAAYFAGRQALGKAPMPEETVIEAEETGVIEIARHNYKGELRSLAETASKGNVVLLSFTAYNIPASPAYNAILNDIYSLYHDKGLEIYQIAFDPDEVEWKEAARNLPWITVWNSETDGQSVLAAYNVGALPMTFIIERSGELGERVIDPAQLTKAVGKRF